MNKRMKIVTLVSAALLTLCSASLGCKGDVVDYEPVAMPATFRGTTENIITNPQSLNPIYEKIFKHEECTRILQIGDSHVRGHSLPFAVRTKIEEGLGSQATGNDVINYGTSCIASETGEIGVIFSAIGINGATCFSYNKPEMIAKVAEQRPDLVIVSFGTNEAYGAYDEAKHLKNLDSLLTNIRKIRPDVKFLLTTPPGFTKLADSEARSTRVAAAICDYAQANDIAVWNIFDIAGGSQYGCKNWKNAQLTQPDGVHYKPAGYKLQGNMLGEAFLKSYNEYVRHRSE